MRALSLVLVSLILAQTGEPLPKDRPAGKLEVIATFSDDMPTGVTISHKGRIFLTFPRWGDPVRMNVGELKNGKVVPYPSAEINKLDTEHPTQCLLTVQSAVVDARDRLWLCDTGTFNQSAVYPGGPRLLCVDLQSDRIVKTVPIPSDVALKYTYLNDVRFDLRRGQGGVAYITDSSEKGPTGLIVVDLATGKSWRRLSGHPSTQPVKDFQPIVEGRPLLERPAKGRAKYLHMGSDGIALSQDGKRLFYCPLCSRHLYSASAEALADPSVSDENVVATVQDHGDRGFASDGLEFDDRGRLYLTDYEHNAILTRDAKGDYRTLVHDPRLLWPDTMSIGLDGYLYITANQLHRQPRFHEGQDQRAKPYVLFRQKVDAGPVLLK